MLAAPATLTTLSGAITSFPLADPLFQGTVGTPANVFSTNFVASSSTYGFSWPSCNSCVNRVRLGVGAGCTGCAGGGDGGVNVGFVGLGGTTSFRDAHAGSCTNYAQQPEVNYDTSGFDGNLWGR
jgi:hypothetical protein